MSDHKDLERRVNEVMKTNPGTGAKIPFPELLNAGFRVLTSQFDKQILSRIDIKFNNKQYSIAFNSSHAGQSSLVLPPEFTCYGINVSIKEIKIKLQELVNQLPDE